MGEIQGWGVWGKGSELHCPFWASGLQHLHMLCQPRSSQTPYLRIFWASLWRHNCLNYWPLVGYTTWNPSITRTENSVSSMILDGFPGNHPYRGSLGLSKNNLININQVVERACYRYQGYSSTFIPGTISGTLD